MIKEKSVNKIIIIRFGAIGDVVHSSGLFRSLKKYNPDLEIHYATFFAPSQMIQNDPDLKKVWIIEGKSYKQLAKLAQELKKERFDLCINLQPSIRTRIFTFLSGIKSTLIYKKDFKFHAVKNFWMTVKPVFKDLILDEKLKIYLPETAINKVSDLVNNEKTLIGLNLGATMVRQGRRWPVAYWRELAKNILEKYNCEIILTGSEDEKELCEKLLDVSPNIKSFCGKLSITESAALMSRCKLIISGDTGPLHIATALGVPTIGLYGAAPIERTGPYGKNNFPVKSDRKCVPCNRRKCKYVKEGDTPCLEDITPEQILEIIKENNLI